MHFGERFVRRLEHRAILFWSLHGTYWLFVWLLLSLVVRIFRPAVVAPERSIAIHVVTSFLATAFLRWLLTRRQFLGRMALSPLGVVLGGVIVIAVVQTLVEDRFLAVAGFGAGFDARIRVVAMLALRLTVLFGWALSYLVLRLVAEHQLATVQASEARAEAERSELRQLQAQMDPHFLFNALNAVLSCKEDPENVETVTHALAEYLRFCLRDTAPLEPLGRELDALESYLTVQEIRFGENLACTINCDRQARDIMVPPRLVQPLLENAFKYGAATNPMPLRVEVSARLVGDQLEVEVANVGRWVPADATRSTGIGMRSLRKRLAFVYGAAATVQHVERDDWVRVFVRLPAKKGQPRPRPTLEESAA